MKTIYTGSMLLNTAGMVILFLLWWPLRGTTALRSIPWFLGALALSWAASALSEPVVTQYKAAINAGHLSAVTVANFALATIIIGSVWKFLCYLLLSANAAFLLDRIGYSSQIITILKRLYDFHILIGCCLIATGAVSGSLLWIMINFSLWVK
ncbi:MAG: hypothetical protein BGO12_19270 [Verrucomicrobia bacterium 61-8]|nr:hypothetical protein [Verrucomicrobiota bacterium]OJV07523.1 MAG: hypothetical protein BGO12_19270 [Verrucomicrobia bacterium 61-8]